MHVTEENTVVADNDLKRALGPWQLIGLGIAIIIGGVLCIELGAQH